MRAGGRNSKDGRDAYQTAGPVDKRTGPKGKKTMNQLYDPNLLKKQFYEAKETMQMIEQMIDEQQRKNKSSSKLKMP